MTGHWVIAIDGPAASGKGTIARAVASRLGLAYLDTGLLYRAVGLSVLDALGNPEDPQRAADAARRLDPTALNDPRLKSDEAAVAASKVAAIPGVRAALLEFQQRFAASPPGAVLDGRDIGTVVCPNATAKLFVTADVETRARRRHQELSRQGEALAFEAVLADLVARDKRDTERAAAPLRPAPDAHLLDTSNLSIEAAVAAAIDLVSAKLVKS